MRVHVSPISEYSLLLSASVTQNISEIDHMGRNSNLNVNHIRTVHQDLSYQLNFAAGHRPHLARKKDRSETVHAGGLAGRLAPTIDLHRIQNLVT